MYIEARILQSSVRPPPAGAEPGHGQEASDWGRPAWRSATGGWRSATGDWIAALSWPSMRGTGLLSGCHLCHSDNCITVTATVTVTVTVTITVTATVTQKSSDTDLEQAEATTGQGISEVSFS